MAVPKLRGTTRFVSTNRLLLLFTCLCCCFGWLLLWLWLLYDTASGGYNVWNQHQLLLSHVQQLSYLSKTLVSSENQNNETTTTTKTEPLAAVLYGDYRAYGVGRIWDTLLQHYSRQLQLQLQLPQQPQQSSTTKRGVAAAVVVVPPAAHLPRSNNSKVLEVGMHRAIDCIKAAKAGFEAHCVEPSPHSFPRVQHAVNQLSASASSLDVFKRIHLYNKAAGDTTGLKIEFSASGSTGDHVGSLDAWKMKKEQSPDQAAAAAARSTIQVEMMRMDDIIQGQNFYLAKIDTQGFEPSVFAGLNESLSRHLLDYILLEYWPKGMDLYVASNSTVSEHERCRKSTELLSQLHGFGYRLYPLKVETHPKAPAAARNMIRPLSEQRPLNDFRQHCLWYYALEQTYPSADYHMGYWTDMFAVAPHVTWLPTF